MIGAKKELDVTADALLAERIRQGDRTAEDELVKRYWSGLLVMFKARLRNTDPEEAYDLTQNTFIGVLQAIRAGKLREPEKLAGFIHGVARNVLNSFFEDGRPGVELTEEVSGRDPVEMLEAADRQRRAHAAINSLSPVDQQILLGVLVDGLSLEEIAIRLKMTPANVRIRKLRAIKKLKKKFARVSQI